MYSTHEEIEAKAQEYIHKGSAELARSRTVTLLLAVQQLKSALAHFTRAAKQCQDHLSNSNFPALAQAATEAHGASCEIEFVVQHIRVSLGELE